MGKPPTKRSGKKLGLLVKLDRFLMLYAVIQLWTFVTLMVLCAVIYIANPTIYYYEVVTPDQEARLLFVETINITGLNLTASEREALDQTQEFEKISSVKAKELEKEFKRLSRIALVCIAGWFISVPEKRKRSIILYKKIKEKIKELNKE